MAVKECVAPVIYDESGKIFLMSSDKWDGWVIPGGGIEPGETELEALKRETSEEMGIEIAGIAKHSIVRIPSDPHFTRETTDFVFHHYIARAVSTDVKPNDEIRSWGWFTFDDALKLRLVPDVRKLLEEARKRVEEKIGQSGNE